MSLPSHRASPRPATGPAKMRRPAPAKPSSGYVQLPEPEKRSLCESLLGAAAKYFAVSTASPKLPAGMKLPLERQIIMLRSLRGWTQHELAQHAGVNQTDVSRAESGNPVANPYAVKQMCNVLGIPH